MHQHIVIVIVTYYFGRFYVRVQKGDGIEDVALTCGSRYVAKSSNYQITQNFRS